MTRETDADRLAMIRELDGVEATWSPLGAASSTLFVLLESTVAEFGGDAQARRELAIARSSDVANARPGDELTIAGVSYRVTAATPDGTGMTELNLTRI